MKIPGFAFETTDWEAVEPTVHAGKTGEARWRTRHFGEIRVRIVEYSAGYKADHWCEKGHVIFLRGGGVTDGVERWAMGGVAGGDELSGGRWGGGASKLFGG